MNTTPSAPTDPVPGTARDIARAVRDGRVTAASMVERAFRRIRERNPEIRAFLSLREEEAMAEAEALARRPDLATLPLAGVPIGVKDNLAVAGMPVTSGSGAVETRPAAADNPAVARLRAAGAIVVGKTTLPELGIWATTDGLWGVTRNPRKPDRTPGGSSGGSAAAVAAGMVPLALGNDGLGSVRIPAACCGIPGLKLGRATAPTGLVGGDWYEMAVNGPLARTVGDVALAASILADRTDLDVGALADDEGTATSPLRIAVSVRSPAAAVKVDPEWIGAARKAAHLLRQKGHVVVEAEPPYALLDAIPVAARWLAGVAEVVDSWGADLRWDGLQRRTRVHARLGQWVRRLGGPRERPKLRAARRLHGFLSGYDALLTPALAQPPIAAGPWIDRSWIANIVSNASYAPFFAAWNLVDAPAGVVATGTHPDGTPLAVQIVGNRGAEARVLDLMLVLEDALRLPPG